MHLPLSEVDESVGDVVLVGLCVLLHVWVEGPSGVGVTSMLIESMCRFLILLYYFLIQLIFLSNRTYQLFQDKLSFSTENFIRSDLMKFSVENESLSCNNWYALFREKNQLDQM